MVSTTRAVRLVADSQRPHQTQESSSFPADLDWYLVRRPRVWRPPTDVYETDEAVIVKVEIAGMKEDELHITFADHALVISGLRRDPVGKIIYQNMEILYGEFRTEVRVDWSLERQGIEATYEDGFLFVRLPKARERRVPIQVREGRL
jgi:HSP20 family molecular chaperone IbpA